MNAQLARERLHDVAAIIESRAVTPSTAAQMIRDIANDLVVPEGKRSPGPWSNRPAVAKAEVKS